VARYRDDIADDLKTRIAAGEFAAAAREAG